MTPTRALRLAAPLLATLALSACATPSLMRPRQNDQATVATASATAWATTLLAAQRDVERGRHADADKLLRDFADRSTGSPEAAETMYWRAVFMLDPGASNASTRDALGLLARYLDARVPLAHRTEALVMQRIGTALAAARESASTAGGTRPVATEAEVKALKDELEQTKAELERIKKRLAPPPAAPATPPPSPDAE